MRIIPTLLIFIFLLGCATQPGTTTQPSVTSAEDSAFYEQVRTAQAQQAENWSILLKMTRENGSSFGGTTDDMAALTILQQNANLGSEVYNSDEFESFIGGVCAPSALAAADRVTDLLFRMEQVVERDSGGAPLPEKRRVVNGLQTNAAAAEYRPMCEQLAQRQAQRQQALSALAALQAQQNAEDQAAQQNSFNNMVLLGSAVAQARAAERMQQQQSAQQSAQSLQQFMYNNQLQNQMQQLNNQLWWQNHHQDY